MWIYTYYLRKNGLTILRARHCRQWSTMWKIHNDACVLCLKDEFCFLTSDLKSSGAKWFFESTSRVWPVKIEKELENGRRDTLQCYNAYYTFLAIHRIPMNEQGRTHRRQLYTRHVATQARKQAERRKTEKKKAKLCSEKAKEQGGKRNEEREGDGMQIKCMHTWAQSSSFALLLFNSAIE